MKSKKDMNSVYFNRLQKFFKEGEEKIIHGKNTEKCTLKKTEQGSETV